MSVNEEIVVVKLVLVNPDGTQKQLSTDANGNLNVAVAAVP
ncbi:MAG: hypothetical protein ABSB71_13340 [Candidatus Bathyarchaeia archaeon]|jgi:hypothetical protein